MNTVENVNFVETRNGLSARARKMFVYCGVRANDDFFALLRSLQPGRIALQSAPRI